MLQIVIRSLPALAVVSTFVLASPASAQQNIRREQPVTEPLGPGGLLEKQQKGFAEFVNQPPLDLPIRVMRDQWTDEDEKRFGQFVQQIGRAVAARKCNTVKSCMRLPEANVYANKDPKSLQLFADCGKFPYMLRAYFSYHNGLPFSYVKEIAMSLQPYSSINNKDRELDGKRLDTSPYGNVILERGGSNVASAPGKEPQLIRYLNHLMQLVSTRTLRVGPLSPNYHLADLYPVKLDRSGIGPGTLVHSTGHALLVWNVEDNGAIRAFDAHPDGSLQFKNVQPATLDRSRPDQGLGFFRFRPLRLTGAQVAQNGQRFGGQVSVFTDQELFKAGKFSLEQWFGPDANVAPGSRVQPDLWTKAFKKIQFWDYIAIKMRSASNVVQADTEITAKMQDLCNQMQQRIPDVAIRIPNGMTSKPHPEALPPNIYASEDGNWEQYSTPGRDGRLRAMVAEIIRSSVTNYRVAKQGSRNVKYNGTPEQYAASMRAQVAAIDKTCQVKYVNSKGAIVTLSFTQVLKRLNKISFDPYHCVERAWGASGDELKTCMDTDREGRWYGAQQVIRNTVGKLNANGEQNVRSTQPITIQMLRDPRLIDQPDDVQINLGTTTPPVMDLDANFASPKFIELLQR